MELRWPWGNSRAGLRRHRGAQRHQARRHLQNLSLSSQEFSWLACGDGVGRRSMAAEQSCWLSPASNSTIAPVTMSKAGPPRAITAVATWSRWDIRLLGRVFERETPSQGLDTGHGSVVGDLVAVRAGGSDRTKKRDRPTDPERAGDFGKA